MKLKIRYENEYQTIVLNEQDTEAMWVSLSLDGEGLSQEEKESRIQEAWNETFNKPEYNCWHIPTSQLKEWAENELKPKAILAYNGEGAYVPGE